MPRKPKRSVRHPPTIVAPSFECVVVGRAVSAQARIRFGVRDWRSKVANAASEVWPQNRPPSSEAIEIRISEFCEDAVRDRDNLAKPILDALQGLVYADDRQVKRLHVEWCDINGAYRVRVMSPLVATALCRGLDFVWIPRLAV